MQCTQAQSKLDDYIDSELTLDDQYQLATHLQQCADCRYEYKQRQVLQQQLKDLSVPPLRAEFIARVSASLGNGGKSQRRGFIVGFSSAIAASLAIVVIVSSMLLKPVQDVALLTVQLSPNELHKVSLVFNSPVAVTQATMSIELPGNVELAGYPGRRNLTWTTTLQQGNNRLQLPLILHGQQTGRVVTRISHGDKAKTFYLNVDAARKPNIQL